MVEEVEEPFAYFYNACVCVYYLFYIILRNYVFFLGYKYHYPFLDESCGVKVIDHKFVRPLYKMMINISQPSMAFLGIPMRSMFFSTSNLQVRHDIYI